MAGTGLFLLFGHVAGAAGHFSRLLHQTAGAGLGLVSSIMVASSLDSHRLMLDLFSLLWPIAPLVAGIVLAEKPSREQGDRRHGPCAQWAFE